jgi:hypothetical protein
MGFLKKALFPLVAILLPVCLLAGLPAHALQSISPAGLNLEISPLPIELKAEPGTSTSTDLKLKNSGKSDEKIKVSLKTFSAEGKDGQITIHDPTPADDFINWISFDRTTLELSPGQEQSVHMSVNLPSRAAHGYYYAVEFELANPPKPQPGGAGLQGAVAMFVLLNAHAPGELKKIQVSSFTADHNSYEFLPVNFNVRLHNSGNIHTTAYGNIFIKRGKHQVASLPINEAKGLILPGNNRRFSASWDNGFPAYVNQTDSSGKPINDAQGNPQKHLKWDISKISHLRFGHYTANLVMVYNDGQSDVPITGTLSFWVIPWRLLGFALALIIIIGAVPLLIYILLSRRKKTTTKNGKKKTTNG